MRNFLGYFGQFLTKKRGNENVGRKGKKKSRGYNGNLKVHRTFHNLDRSEFRKKGLKMKLNETQSKASKFYFPNFSSPILSLCFSLSSANLFASLCTQKGFL